MSYEQKVRQGQAFKLATTDAHCEWERLLATDLIAARAQLTAWEPIVRAALKWRGTQVYRLARDKAPVDNPSLAADLVDAVEDMARDLRER